MYAPHALALSGGPKPCERNELPTGPRRRSERVLNAQISSGGMHDTRRLSFESVEGKGDPLRFPTAGPSSALLLRLPRER